MIVSPGRQNFSVFMLRRVKVRVKRRPFFNQKNESKSIHGKEELLPGSRELVLCGVMTETPPKEKSSPEAIARKGT